VSAIEGCCLVTYDVVAWCRTCQLVRRWPGVVILGYGRVVSWCCSGGSTLLEDFDWLMHFSLTFFAHPNSAKTAEVFVEHWVMLSVLRKRFRFRGNFSIIRTDKTKKRKRKNFRCRFRRTIRTGLNPEILRSVPVGGSSMSATPSWWRWIIARGVLPTHKRGR
jgi:hypothetical protein